MFNKSSRSVALKTRYFEISPEKKLPGQELIKLEFPGLYTAYDDYSGTMIACNLPNIFGDYHNLVWAITNIKDYFNLREQYQQHIKDDPLVKWFLIPFVIMSSNVKKQVPGFSDIPIWDNELFNNKILFNALLEDGAEYQHNLFIPTPFDRLDDNYFKVALSIFGKQANSILGKTTLIAIFSTRRVFNKVKELLEVGADINEIIDEKYENTILQYLIACEMHNYAVELINLTENMPKTTTSTKNNWEIEYTLQDKQGKTPLFFAVGLGLTSVVEKLLSLMKGTAKNKHIIGLDIPDHKGRTSVMIAAALGRKEILEMLISAGCNLLVKDNQGRDLLWYIQAPEKEIRDILEFLSVHPDRVIESTFSNLCVPSRDYAPLVLVDDKGQETPIILSPKEPHLTILSEAIVSLYEKPTEPFEGCLNEVTRQFVPMMEKLHQKITVPTISEQCLSNQPKIRNFVRESLLRLVCVFGDIGKVEQYIINDQVNPNACDWQNRTSLHFTVMGEALVKDFLVLQQVECTIDTIRNCMENHIKVLLFLLEHGGDLAIKNSNGNTPLSLFNP